MHRLTSGSGVHSRQNTRSGLCGSRQRLKHTLEVNRPISFLILSRRIHTLFLVNFLQALLGATRGTRTQAGRPAGEGGARARRGKRNFRVQSEMQTAVYRVLRTSSLIQRAHAQTNVNLQSA